LHEFIMPIIFIEMNTQKLELAITVFVIIGVSAWRRM
jgi:hypothetical protein